MFYFSTISWLWSQQETMWVNINFERRDLTSAEKSPPTPCDFGGIFVFNSTKQNVAHFSFIFLTENSCCAPEKPGTVRFSISHQRWLILVFPCLICSPTKQTYSKVDNSRMYRSRNAVFNSNFYFAWQGNFRWTFECLFFMSIRI